MPRIIISDEDWVQRLLLIVICQLMWKCLRSVSIREASKVVIAQADPKLEVRLVHVKGWTTKPSIPEKGILYNTTNGSSL